MCWLLSPTWQGSRILKRLPCHPACALLGKFFRPCTGWYTHERLRACLSCGVLPQEGPLPPQLILAHLVPDGFVLLLITCPGYVWMLAFLITCLLIFQFCGMSVCFQFALMNLLLDTLSIMCQWKGGKGNKTMVPKQKRISKFDTHHACVLSFFSPSLIPTKLGMLLGDYMGYFHFMETFTGRANKIEDNKSQ